MASVKSAGGKSTEAKLAALFKRERISGWRRNSMVIGHPDFLFSRLKIAVFVDGCFWHGCPRHATQPKTNAAFWRKKIATNQARDRRVNRALRGRGWRVVRVWEHELTKRNEPRLVRRLLRLTCVP